MTNKKQVVVLPCSGIGKVYGSVGREAAYNSSKVCGPGWL